MLSEINKNEDKIIKIKNIEKNFLRAIPTHNAENIKTKTDK